MISLLHYRNMGVLRTKEGQEKYMAYIKSGGLESGCALCKKEKILKEFNFWKVVPNDFPYDQIASTHDMLISKRHCTEADLTEEELKEFVTIKNSYIQSEYEWIFEATKKKKSIPGHFHIHLLIAKDR